MPFESSGKDLQIIAGHFYIRLLLHGVICMTECQRPSNCFSCSCFLFFPGHFLVNFSQQLLYRNRKTGYKISMKLYMCTYGLIVEV